VPDRHLAGACVGRLQPDLLISESTYATSVRESKVAREGSMMAAVSTPSTREQLLMPLHRTMSGPCPVAVEHCEKLIRSPASAPLTAHAVFAVF
jgi:hypothetical protein